MFEGIVEYNRASLLTKELLHGSYLLDDGRQSISTHKFFGSVAWE